MTGPRFYDYSDFPHFVYRCYDADERLIYVGCTVDPTGRIATHRTASWWGHEIDSVRLIVFPNKRYALRKEREAIADEQPRWNLKGRWNHRRLWTVDDYVDYRTALVMSGNVSGYYNTRHLARVFAEAKHRYGVELVPVAS